MKREDMIRQACRKDIILEGPVEATENSYPFDSMRHCRMPYDLEKIGYCEEEYFASGYANVYDDDNGRLVVKKEGLPYKTRLLIRKPIKEEQFSGRVYLDILNATNGYDHEDLWTRIYDWCVRNGHAYVGITSKPITVLALKTFDYERYRDLNWSNGEQVSQPVCHAYDSIPGTEEGLFWDMLSQTACRIKSKVENNLINGWNVRQLYLTGQSQSGAYLNTYVHYFDQYMKNEDGSHIYDGYMNIVGAFVARKVCQQKMLGPLTFDYQENVVSEVPYIKMSSEGDLYLFKGFGTGDDMDQHLPKNEDTEKNKSRYYEIPGSPHFDIKCPVIVSDQDVIKAGRKPHVIPSEEKQFINDFPLAYYIVGLLEKLHIWATEGIAPEVICNITRNDDGTIKRDKDGNAEGGLRSVLLEVPLASYEGCDMGAHMGVVGTMKFFDKEAIQERYKDREHYLELFNEYIEKEVKEGWLLEEDAATVKEWADRSISRILEV